MRVKRETGAAMERCLASASAKPTARQVARPMVSKEETRGTSLFLSTLYRLMKAVKILGRKVHPLSLTDRAE